MNKSAILRLVFLPIGLIRKLWNLSLEGSRDINNKYRFKNAIIDEGSSIDEKSIIEPSARVLDNCIVNNSQIASYSYIGKNCIIQNTSIGKFCSIAPNVFIGLGQHPTNLFSTSTLFYRSRNALKIKFIDKDHDFKEYDNISIGHDVWIGTRAIIMDGITVGNGAIIAANSVITKDVPPYAIVAGIPGKVVKYRFHEERIEEMQKLEWWNWPLEEIRLKMNELNKL